MDLSRPNPILGLAYAVWAVLGLVTIGVISELAPRAMAGQSGTLVLLLAAPMTVSIGVAFHSYRARSVSPAALAAVAATLLATVLTMSLWELSSFALVVTPPAFAGGSFLFVSAFLGKGQPMSRAELTNALGYAAVVILPAILASGWIPNPALLLLPGMTALLSFVVVAWVGMYLLQRRWLNIAPPD